MFWSVATLYFRVFCIILVFEMSLTDAVFVAVKKGSLLLPEKFLGNGHANNDDDTGMLHCFLL